MFKEESCNANMVFLHPMVITIKFIFIKTHRESLIKKITFGKLGNST